MNKKPAILYISSADPTVRAGRWALDYFNAFRKAGYDVDLLTKYKVKNHPEIYSVFPYGEKHITVGRLFRFGMLLCSRFAGKVVKALGIGKKTAEFSHIFFYKYEDKPPVSNKRLNGALPENKHYDLVIILFWQGMLSAASLEMLYDKYGVQIIVSCADYSPMTGGCHFIGDCTNYINGCGCCPEFKSSNPHDFTHENALYKERVYRKINPIMVMNHYMYDNYASKSFVSRSVKSVFEFPIIDEEIFRPMDKQKTRNELGIDGDRKVILFACQDLSDVRKGIKYIIEALNIFFASLSPDDRNNVEVITAGMPDESIIRNIPFRNRNFGYVDIYKLAKMFGASDVYLSGAVIDAGPMMVNQALSSGIPVVAFQIGTALEVIKDQGTGYCAKTADSADFANGISWWYGLTGAEYGKISEKCREKALRTTSYSACVNRIIDIYNGR